MARNVDHLVGASGVLLRREALEIGLDDNALRDLVRAGVLVRIRQGAYADRECWTGADDRGRQVLASTAVMRQYDGHVALSHSSAAIAHGAPAWGLDLRDVHVTHLSGGGRRSAKVVHHRGSCRVEDLTRTNGHWLTSPTRTVLDTTSIVRAEAGVVQTSHFLHERLTTEPALVAAQRAMKPWPNSLAWHVVLRLADSRYESVGESRCAYLFWKQGLPAPEPQWEVRHPDGSLVGRVDFAWPRYRLMLEFDGRTKYLKYLRQGESVTDVVLREKRREDQLRELTGWTMLRLVWSDLASPTATASRIRQKLALGT